MENIVHVVGRFPPPLDGQSIATARLASLLESAYEVRRHDTAYKEQALMPGGLWERVATTLHYASHRRQLFGALARAPEAPVLWCSISPGFLGHVRDVAVTAPCFRPQQPVWSVIHRGNFDRVFRRRLTRPTIRALVKRLRGFVFLSRRLANQVSLWVPPDKLCVIPNTIDAAVVSTPGEVVLKRLEKSGRSQLRLLFLSNMIREKGYLDVLDAAALLKAKGLPISMTFVGRWNDKMDRDAFYNRMSSLGVSDVVRHRGAVYDRAAIKALHLESDVLVMPTYYRDEGQPLVIIESLAAGTPVLVTGHASIPEMVMDGREALFVRPRSPEDIAMAAEKLAEPDVWAHASGCARQRFESYFSEEVVRRRWLGLLRT